MPRRKRTTAQNERQRKVRRTDNNEDALVISDSENEEEEDCAIKLSPRAARWRERGNKVQIQDMTEEEMLDLAMRLSKQEANTAAHRQQLEDDDMKKAIAESLHVSQCQDTEGDSEPISLTPKPCQDPHIVMGPLRRKLSFPNKNEMHSANSGDAVAVAVSSVDSMQEVSPLPPMPDLSQRTLSQLPPLSPSLPSVPSTSSQWKDEVLDAGSPEQKPSQNNSQLRCSPAFLRQCSVRLGQDVLRASQNAQSTHDCSTNLTSSFQLDLPQSPLKSPVFAKTDPKGGTELSGIKDGDSFTDSVCSPNEEENFQKSSSHKNLLSERTDCPKRLSLCRKAQPLNRVTVPDGEDGGGDICLKQEPLEPNQMKDEYTHGTSLTSVFEKSAKSEKTPLAEETFKEFTSHMLLHLSDEEEEEEKVAVQSPVFHQESVSRARHLSLFPTQPCCSLRAAATTTTTTTTTTTIHTLSHSNQESNSQDVLQRKIIPKTAYPAESDQPEVPRKWGIQDTSACDSQFTEGNGEGLVSYYWGVPFCPKGQNPDDYTSVILSQLEVYEKSLKTAQRGLLRKVDWGLPVCPCPLERSFGRRFKRHRAPRLMGEDDEENDEEPEQQQQEEQKKAEEAGEERAESQAGPDERTRNGQGEPYVVVSSPEAQEELTQKSLLFGQQESMDALKSSRKSSHRDCSPIQQRDEYEEGQHEQCDVANTVCPETQLSKDSTPDLMVTSPVQPQSRADSEVMEVDEEGTPPAIDEERMEQEQGEEEEEQREPHSPLSQTVACPMCCCFFTRNKIEMHAAYCDGTTELHKQRVPALRKRTGRIAMGEASPRSEKSEEQEKCYLCFKFFSRDKYTQHVPQCLQQKTLRPNQGNGLLAALDQTEKGHIDDYEAGPSDITIQSNRGLADPSAMAEDVGSGSCSASDFCVSSSPIKSFTPISEAKDCFIDFKHQYSSKPSQRLGRKRKFKR
ncbi:BRCA1-A complex subunit RAP80 isoform X2 [Electrophorus electricus]|uniref:BRCA1-A complex subunit RAP80 isoform X2 n=1 Tax=Electrophorus electricus TaxID=8005 RepID=UPI0015CF9F5F|nr:BRCA1-A complex subunit RAP80 isoform X2 [Electrophorus electricus]